LPASAVAVTVSPAVASVVGVAYPITARFSHAVAARAVAERGMRVYVANRLVVGAWTWKDLRTALFRPRAFWPGHVLVVVRLSLAGAVLATTRTQRFIGRANATRVHWFHTGRKLIATINGRSHRMNIYLDGHKVRTFKVSLGKPGFETRSGIKAVMEKYRVRHMTSKQLGLTAPSDQYDLMAPYATRITPSGEFVHGAPWAAGRIGRWNGSHGCTNLFTADAHWFYDHTITGDPVITTGTSRPMEHWNGLGAPWNIPWSQWLAHSSLKVQTA
jgi:lipoprotein-anchoring transpeptidase ErfK/SrfK